jgi:biotin transport system substrate-specific component
MRIKQMALVSLFAALTAIGGIYSFPLPLSPVPITLQSLVTLLAGLILGSRLGALSQIVYIALGVAGLPVFSKGQAGIGVLLGPTGGYLLGFIAAAYIIGLLTERNESNSFSKLFFIFILATLIIYILGVGRLIMVTGIPFGKALVSGMFYFLPGDLLKVVISSLVGRQVHRALTAANLTRLS